MLRVLLPPAQQLTCETCKEALLARIERVTSDWINIKV